MQKLIVQDQQQLFAATAKIAQIVVDKPIQIDIKQISSKRSIQQNAYYWGVLVTATRDHVFEATGLSYTSEDVHEDFKERFSPIRVARTLDGKEVRRPKSTTQMSVSEFAEYMTKIEVYVTENLDVRLPADPKQWAA